MSGDVPSDETLAVRAKRGDEAAFAVLMGRHKAALYRLARRCIGDPDESLDIVQESFVSAWSALHAYDPARPFAAWLRTIALNKCRDFSRRRRVRALVFGIEPADPTKLDGHPDPAPSAEDEVARQERSRRLDRAIVALPHKLKEALILTAMEGLSQQEAANLLGVTVKSIEARVYRAKRRLALTLGAPLSP